MYAAKTLELVLNQIIKDDKFKLDEITGYFYINNRVDNTFLFEYHPSNMCLYVSNIVFEYIKYNRLLNQDPLQRTLIKLLSTMYDLQFRTIVFDVEGVINKCKFQRLYNIIHDKVQKDILEIPYDYFEFSKIEFELRTHVKFEENRIRGLITHKSITSNFNKIDISNLCSGYYSMWIYVPNTFYGKKIHLQINNT